MGNQAGRLNQRLTSHFSKRRSKMKKMMVMFQQALWSVKNEKGAAAIEYGLLAGLIAVLIIAGATLAGTSLNTIFSVVASKLSSVATAATTATAAS
jgi:pilus assembly protein Flp/PilA